MKRIFLDFETYYDKEYTLKKLNPLEYILDHRWEMLGCGVIVDDGHPRYYPQEKVIDWLRTIDEPYAAISHNSLFDMTILAWRYGIHPPAMVDTLGLARAMLSHKTKRASVSLASVLEYYGLEQKLTTIQDMEGVHFRDLVQDPDLLLRFTTYTIRDVRGCREIYNRLMPDFPTAELRVMDRLIRMVTMPQLLLDELNLRIYHKDIMAIKFNLMARFGHERTKFMSNDQFADLLREVGVQPPMKVSPRTGKDTYAFAKTDEEFLALKEHPNEEVQWLVAARLGLKSTIEETRTKAFINLARLAAERYGHPWLPVPLNYSGAHTHRFSGAYKLNMQNLSNRKTKILRSCIRAPYGTTILAIDASQIEARLVAWLAGQKNLLEQFRNPANDVYSWFGSHVLGYTITRKSHPVERFTFKTVVLGLGFGMSAEKLLYTLRNAAADNDIKVEYTIEQCVEWVRYYRDFLEYIPQLWRRCSAVIDCMYNPALTKWSVGPCYVEGHTIVLPSGLKLYYNDLQLNDNQYTYRFGAMRRKIYGGKLTENIVQALDRQHVVEANMRIEDRCAKLGLDIRLAMQVHDENVYVVPDNCLQLVKQIGLEEMCRPPKWAPDIPLAAEAKTGVTYGELG